ncbi:MAG: hypothetical protein AVDCRST_MAG02-2511, partial [uncultured Rubrobacteraceae bacterium]
GGQGRGARPASPADSVQGERRDPARLQHQRDGLHRGRARGLRLPGGRAGARRHDPHGYPKRRRRVEGSASFSRAWGQGGGRGRRLRDARQPGGKPHV